MSSILISCLIPMNLFLFSSSTQLISSTLSVEVIESTLPLNLNNPTNFLRPSRLELIPKIESRGTFDIVACFLIGYVTVIQTSSRLLLPPAARFSYITSFFWALINFGQ